MSVSQITTSDQGTGFSPCVHLPRHAKATHFGRLFDRDPHTQVYGSISFLRHLFIAGWIWVVLTAVPRRFYPTNDSINSTDNLLGQTSKQALDG